MDTLATDGVREALERSAREIHARRDELVLLVVEGENDDLNQEREVAEKREAYLREIAERKDDAELKQVFSLRWTKTGFNRLTDSEIAICQEGLGYWTERNDPSRKPEDSVPPTSWCASLGPAAVFPAELCPISMDEKWPFNLSAAPTARGEAALFLAEVHDTFYRIGGNGIFEGALRYLESTPDGTRGAVYARLAAKYACYASGDFGPEHLFPAFDGKPVAACDVEAALEKMMGMVFVEAAEPVVDVTTADDGDGQGGGDDDLDATEVNILRIALDHGAIARHCLTTKSKIAEEMDSLWTRDSIKKQTKRLSAFGFMEGRAGNGGGVWLTEKGVEVAKSFKQVGSSSKIVAV